MLLVISTAPGLLFCNEHYGELAMRARKEDFFQVPPYLQLLGLNQALSVTAALKTSGFLQEAGGPVSALIFSFSEKNYWIFLYLLQVAAFLV